MIKKVAFKFTIALTFIIVRELNLSNRRMEDEYPRDQGKEIFRSMGVAVPEE